MRRVGPLLLVAVAALAAGCSVDQTVGNPVCTGQTTSALIAAQSVPTASLIACFEGIPSGWESETVEIDQDGTVIVMDSDRAGERAATFRFLSECDVEGAVATPTEREGVERFELIHQIEPSFQAERYYVFDGGCVWWTFDFDPDTPTALSIGLDNSVVLVSREEINDQLRETFVDAEL